MIVAWHEVPGKSVYRENRPVGYGMIGRGPDPKGISRRKVRRVSYAPIIESVCTPTRITSCPTGRRF
jgi:hypothetical protein